MIALDFARVFIFAFAASYFTALTYRAPGYSAPVSALIASAGYLVYLLLEYYVTAGPYAYFAGALVMAVLSEGAARIMGMPSTIFITTAVIPLVPGAGLYETMRLLTEGSYRQAGVAGATSMLAIGAMAIAIALTTLSVKLIRHIAATRKQL